MVFALTPLHSSCVKSVGAAATGSLDVHYLFGKVPHFGKTYMLEHMMISFLKVCASVY